MLNSRLDRVVSVHLSLPIVRVLSRKDRACIPILMYHRIADGTTKKHPYYETNTSQQAFAQQMKFLRENGYRTVTLDAALNSVTEGRIENKSVVITFDDGYRDFHTEAYPVLAEHNFTATVFLVTGLIRNQRIQREGVEYLTWTEVRELRSQGIQIGSHTVNHPELKSLNARGIEYQIGRSKQTIEEELSGSIQSFSYPFAFPESNRSLIGFLSDTLERYGYQNGVSTVIGTAARFDNRFFLPRLPVNLWDDDDFFRAKLEGAYDWLHPVQYASKLIRAKLA